MKILFGLSGFYPYHKAGTETYVLYLARELINVGYKVSVIIPAVGEKIGFYRYEGIEVYSFFVPKKITTKELNGLEKPSGIEEFELLLKEIKPDIFHLHSLSRSLHAEHLKIVSEMGVKIVFTAHLGGDFCVRNDLILFDKEPCNGIVKRYRCLSCFIHKQKTLNKTASQFFAYFINTFITNSFLVNKVPAFRIVDYKQEQLKLLRKHASAYIAIADWLKHIYSLNGLNDVIVIKQAIGSNFVEKNSKEKRDINKIQLIFVGRMHPIKNFGIILDALKSHREHFNFIVVTIPFEDEMDYYENVKEQYHDLNFADWFENLSSTDVAVKLEESDILILPSRFEAAPLVILEAFAKKVPVIGSDYIAIKEMVNHNVNGLLFKNGDAESLKQQLLRLINESGLIRKLSNNIEPVRTFEDVAKEHHEVYKKL